MIHHVTFPLSIQKPDCHTTSSSSSLFVAILSCRILRSVSILLILFFNLRFSHCNRLIFKFCLLTLQRYHFNCFVIFNPLLESVGLLVNSESSAWQAFFVCLFWVCASLLQLANVGVSWRSMRELSVSFFSDMF